MPAKLTTISFISRSKKIHNDFYDYSLVVYINSLIHVLIICPEHGLFKQLPKIHIKGSGCSECKNKKQSINSINSKEFFVEKSKLKHNNLYTYENFVYDRSNKKSWITCSKHGDFSCSANNHMRGTKCPNCKIDKLIERFTKTHDNFLKEAHQIHGNDFLYLSMYKNGNIKMLIQHNICKRTFKQTPYNHLRHGCIACRESFGEAKIRKIMTINDLKFNKENRFDDCRYIRPLPFDFYLPDYNVCIEYNGPQHYEPSLKIKNKKFTLREAEEIFRIQKIKNDIKKEYCQNKGIKLIIIPYWDFDNIQHILKHELHL